MKKLSWLLAFGLWLLVVPVCVIEPILWMKFGIGKWGTGFCSFIIKLFFGVLLELKFEMSLLGGKEALCSWITFFEQKIFFFERTLISPFDALRV